MEGSWSGTTPCPKGPGEAQGPGEGAIRASCVSAQVCRWFCFFLNNISVSRLAVALAHSFCTKASLNGKRIIYTDIKHLYLGITIYIKEVGLLSPYLYGVVEALLLVYKLFLALLLIYLTSRARLGVSRFMLC